MFSLKKADLFRTCVLHHEMLHEQFQQFTPLAQLMRRHEPRTFLSIITGLLDRGIISLEMGIKLLQGEEGGFGHMTSHVMQFLEAVLRDQKRHLVYNEAAPRLVDIYFTSLEDDNKAHSLHPSLTEIQPKGYGHYGKRYTWLNELQPFTGVESLHQPCLRSTQSTLGHKPRNCPCCGCNTVLIKFQSLLCSKFSSSDLYSYVMQQLKVHRHLIGWESLYILAMAHMDVKDAADAVLRNNPKILPNFAASMAESHQDVWSHAVTSLLGKLRETDETDSEAFHLYTTVFKAVLSRTAHSKTMKEFLQLLPPDGSSQFFYKYIEQCRRSNQARALRDIITEKAQTLGQAR